MGLNQWMHINQKPVLNKMMQVLKFYLEAKMDEAAHKKFPESVKSESEKGQIRKQAKSYSLEGNVCFNND